MAKRPATGPTTTEKYTPISSNCQYNHGFKDRCSEGSPYLPARSRCGATCSAAVPAEQRPRAERCQRPVHTVSIPYYPRNALFYLTKPMNAHATMTEVLFFAVPPMMKPMKSSTFPPMMNHRRPNRSEFAPQILVNRQMRYRRQIAVLGL